MIDDEQRAHDLTLLILQNHWDDLEGLRVSKFMLSLMF